MKLLLSTILVLTFSTFYVYAASLSQLQNQENLQQLAQQLISQYQGQINQAISLLPAQYQQLAQQLLNQLIGSKDLWDEIQTYLPTIINLLPTIISIFGKRSIDLSQYINFALSSIPAQYQQLAQLAINFIQNLLNGNSKGINDSLSELWGHIQLLGSNVINIGISTLVGALGDSNLLGLLGGIGKRQLDLSQLIGSLLQQSLAAAQQFISTLPPTLQAIAQQILAQIIGSRDLWDEIQTYLPTIINLLPTIISIFGKRQLVIPTFDLNQYIQSLYQQYGALAQQFISTLPPTLQAIAQQILNQIIGSKDTAEIINLVVSLLPTILPILGSLFGKRQIPISGF